MRPKGVHEIASIVQTVINVHASALLSVKRGRFQTIASYGWALVNALIAGGGAWRWECVASEYLKWARAMDVSFTKHDTRNFKSTLALCYGVSTARGLHARLCREFMLPPHVPSYQPIKPPACQFPMTVYGADVYFRALPIACIRDGPRRRAAARAEAQIATPTGEAIFGFGVFVETAHLAFLGATPDSIRQYINANRNKVSKFEIPHIARPTPATVAFHDSLVLSAIERGAMFDFESKRIDSLLTPRGMPDAALAMIEVSIAMCVLPEDKRSSPSFPRTDSTSITSESKIAELWAFPASETDDSR